ncbi:hypothetical protein GKZ28_19755 [Clostridium chromiireducens]|uniref:HNH domain-containing protein n=1 Tax=Clostridium chromiireducens TaxID=225345 RepID=A0A964W457_9CLOT|nr:hypothetical protein [Clostridium chromiireducens]MVX65917.1 hypothetical protein [Clostridium chromiireducens]
MKRFNTSFLAVDPINELVPVCSNCHTVIHSKAYNITTEELREVLQIRV